MSPLIAGVRWLISGVVLVVALRVLSISNYSMGTWVWAACGVALILCWPKTDRSASVRSFLFLRIIVSALVGAVVVWAMLQDATKVLPAIFAGPPDPNRGDMLVVINLAVEQFLGGHNPYRLYYVPWEAPLPYGPLLWAPYIVPKVLGFDSRVLALIGQLAIPAACGLAAVISTVRAQWARAVTLLALAICVAFQPAILQFFRIGHTTVYWPLLLIFAVLVVEERWTACCVVLGFLVAARSTMVAIVPVFLLTLCVQRALSWKRAVLLTASAVVPFLPFLGDIHNLEYGLFGSYQKVMKGFVWHQTTWALTTFGLTSPLLKGGLEHLVELTQAGVMAVVYLIAWIDLRRGRPTLPWMVLALLAFSMTTLWPVLYIYFDVWVLALCGLAATAWHGAWRPRFGAFVLPATLAAAAVPIILIAGKNVRGSSYTIDVGTRAANGMTGSGFGQDIREARGKRTFVWVEGTNARIGVPRAGFGDGLIRISIHPFTPVEGLNQTVTASLNGHPLGMIPLHIGWQDVDFEAQRSLWQYGFNVLDLSFAYAISGAETKTSDDQRMLSVAVDRVTLR